MKFFYFNKKSTYLLKRLSTKLPHEAINLILSYNISFRPNDICLVLRCYITHASFSYKCEYCMKTFYQFLHAKES